MAKKPKRIKILLWLFFSVCASLLPIGVNFINGRFRGAHQDATQLIMGGELFLIAAGIAADAIGRAFVGGDAKQELRVICGFGCLLLLVVTSIYFGDLAFAQEQKRARLMQAVRARDTEELVRQTADEATDSGSSPAARDVTADSVWLFGFTVVTALGVILLEGD